MLWTDQRRLTSEVSQISEDGNSETLYSKFEEASMHQPKQNRLGKSCSVKAVLKALSEVDHHFTSSTSPILNAPLRIPGFHRYNGLGDLGESPWCPSARFQASLPQAEAEGDLKTWGAFLSVQINEILGKSKEFKRNISKISKQTTWQQSHALPRSKTRCLPIISWRRHRTTPWWAVPLQRFSGQRHRHEQRTRSLKCHQAWSMDCFWRKLLFIFSMWGLIHFRCHLNIYIYMY